MRYRGPMKTAVIATAAAVLLGCSPSAPVPRPKPVPPTDTDDCPAACAHLRGEDGSGLSCPEGDRLPPSIEYPKGATCEQFCRDSQDMGHSLRPSCVKRIKSCSDMSAVQQSSDCPFK